MTSRSNSALDAGRRRGVDLRFRPGLETVHFDPDGPVLPKSRAPRRHRAGPPADNAVISSALYSHEIGLPVAAVTKFPKESPSGGTTMPNRSLLARRLAQAIKRAARLGRQLAVLLVDLDRFRSINDSHGHDMGDRVLCAAARRIQSVVGAEGLVVRMDGDEFAVILENVLNQDRVEAAIVRLRAALAEPFHLNGRVMMTTASVGVSMFPRDGASARLLLRNTNFALHESKRRGRDSYQVFRAEMGRRLRRETTLETRLRGAIRDQQLQVFYQPIVDIRTLEVVALESLLRWQHPAAGWIPPERFISLAEETGLIVPIGEFVLDRVLSDAARWQSAGCPLVPIALNISALQLQRTSLYDLVVDRTRSLGVSPSMLQIELTESAMFEGREGRDGVPSQEAIVRLRELGVHVSLDDFGTGYSSLSYLKRWRVDSLKIDRSFVRDLASDPDDLAIVTAICTIARRLNIAVVAEGVEDIQQLATLRELGCELGQGYLFSKAVSADRCMEYLSGKCSQFGVSAPGKGAVCGAVL